MHYFISTEGKKEQDSFNTTMFMVNGTQVSLRMWWTTNHFYRSKFPSTYNTEKCLPYIQSYSTLRWVTWEAVTVVKGIP